MILLFNKVKLGFIFILSIFAAIEKNVYIGFFYKKLIYTSKLKKYL